MLDRAVIARHEPEADVRQLPERVGLGHRERRRPVPDRKLRHESRVLLGRSRLALPQQLHILRREGGEVDEDALVGLEGLELVLREVQVE
jgi:hypothetical protein